MSRLDELRKHLKRGNVYRRADLTGWSKSVDRHLEKLVTEGTLQKVSQGVYYYPKISVFGNVPPDEHTLVRTFLKDDRFLMVSPNLYNGLGVGTTQLYNRMVVYNHKRHGKFKLGNRDFEFQLKHHFPFRISEEFLLVDLVNNLNDLAEDREAVLSKLMHKAAALPGNKFKKALMKYGNAGTKKLFKSLMPENA